MLRFIVVSFLASLFFGCAGTMNLKKVQLPENPKIAAYWTSPVMDLAEADTLAKFHIVITDMDNMKNNYASLVRLKELNPKLKLLCYSNPMELWGMSVLGNRPLQKQVLSEIENNRSAYWLKQPNGEPVIFWNGMKMLNLSVWCPSVKGERYDEFIARFLVKNVLNDNIWDGYFMDNSTGNIAWVGGWKSNHGIDANLDGQTDNERLLDSAWYKGSAKFLNVIRQAKGEKFVMIGNKGSLDFVSNDLLDGKMFEEFPNNYLGDKTADGWFQCLSNYAKTGPYTIVHAKQVKALRTFVLASTLLGDGYFAYAQDLPKTFPEYGKDLGKALAPAQDNGAYWEREFSRGTVRVWPEQKKGEISYR
jgi:hypothetical protein